MAGTMSFKDPCEPADTMSFSVETYEKGGNVSARRDNREREGEDAKARGDGEERGRKGE